MTTRRQLGILLCIQVVTTSLLVALPGQEAARQLLERFCQMDSQGKQLSSEGWRDIVSLFRQTPKAPSFEKAIVIRDFVVSRPLIPTANRSKFYVEYTCLGELDYGAQFLRAAGPHTGPVKVRVEYDLVRTGAQFSISDWKIEGAPREPHISVEAALRYLTELRDRTTDIRIRENADSSLRELKRLQ